MAVVSSSGGGRGGKRPSKGRVEEGGKVPVEEIGGGGDRSRGWLGPAGLLSRTTELSLDDGGRGQGPGRGREGGREGGRAMREGRHELVVVDS